MPIYEYKCSACGKNFELLIRASEKPKCPHCASGKLKKLISGFSANTSAKKRTRRAADCPERKKSCGCCCGGRCSHH